MARSLGNATLMAVSSPSTLFGVSMPTSRCGTLAAVTRPSWAPSGVGINKPSVACVCDYNLGRSHNFTADREFADEVTAAVPDALWVVHENRAFLHRAVRFLLSHDEVVALFTGETLVEPGVVQIPHRRPDQPDEFGADVACYPGYAGVAGID